jgi:hypothetical protein
VASSLSDPGGLRKLKQSSVEYVKVTLDHNAMLIGPERSRIRFSICAN